MKLPDEVWTHDEILSAGLTWSRRRDGHQVAILRGENFRLGHWTFDVFPSGSCVLTRKGSRTSARYESLTAALTSIGLKVVP